MKINIPHDAMGQRIAKTVTNKNTTDGTDKFVTTYYMRDPLHIRCGCNEQAGVMHGNIRGIL